jgi:hypothetical protein
VVKSPACSGGSPVSECVTTAERLKYTEERDE